MLIFALVAWHTVPAGIVGRVIANFGDKAVCERALLHTHARPGERLACHPFHASRTVRQQRTRAAFRM
jgi:hypothetical protein